MKAAPDDPGSTTARADGPDGQQRAIARFREWRYTRPFWAGVLTELAGIAIMTPPYGTLRFGDAVVALKTLGGVSATVLGVVLVMCGLAHWLRPATRIPVSVLVMVVSLLALVAANLGGFLIGTLLGVAGGALGLSWQPAARQEDDR
ncbi:DUF6114 domain-containing protein [Saccharopolyspora sp. NPDC049426]|uniref:DUF6114 domain-containing protein n=1 Tax=Saccharopolyspora sp. NPDC049426 TaxID=3155652 RepID=UPI003436DDE7